MTTQAAHAGETTCGDQVLYMALELSDTKWKVLFATSGGKRRERAVSARDLARLLIEIADAKHRLGLPASARVVSCYEAGRDGFWLHRALCANGIANQIVDSSSIEVQRRARHRKTDRLDLVKLMSLLLRWHGGERRVWSVVRVPSPEEEDVRQLSRAIERLKSERQRSRTRIKSLLALHGIRIVAVGGDKWEAKVGALKSWEGLPLGEHLRTDLLLEGERLALLEKQLRALKAKRDDLVARTEQPAAVVSRKLARLGAIAAESSFVFSTELFGWRRFDNRRQLAGSVGIVGTPWQSGGIDREQGISKAGNRRMRTMLVEIAWCWLRYQPASALSQWWRARFGKASGRALKGGIVALARKLLVALWRYVEHDIVPAGAVLKIQKVAA